MKGIVLYAKDWRNKFCLQVLIVSSFLEIIDYFKLMKWNMGFFHVSATGFNAFAVQYHNLYLQKLQPLQRFH